MKENHAPLALCGLFTALMAVGAFIHIMVPLGIWQVTISLQIFVAVLAGLFPGPPAGGSSASWPIWSWGWQGCRSLPMAGDWGI